MMAYLFNKALLSLYISKLKLLFVAFVDAAFSALSSSGDKKALNVDTIFVVNSEINCTS